METKDDLLRQLEELKKLRNSMDESTKNISKKDRIDNINKKEKELEKTNDVVEILKTKIEEIDNEIKEIENDLIKNAKEYEASYKRFQELIKEEEKNLDDSSLFTAEEIDVSKSYYDKLKLSENNRAKDIKKAFQEQRKLISSLKGKKTKLMKDIEKAEALDLSIIDYNEINSALRKTKIFEAILERKGLHFIISKPSKDRTKEEKELLKETKEEILKEISEVKNKEDNTSILDIIQALYKIDVNYKNIGTRVEFISIDEFNRLKENASKLPVVYKGEDYDNSKEPIKAPEDLENIVETKKEDIDINSNINERIVIFKDKNNGDLYIREYAREKFRDKYKINKLDTGIKIKGSLCFKISEEEANYIIEHANNNFSPYITKIDEIEIEKKEYKPDDFNITKEEFDLLIDNGLTPGSIEFDKEIKEKNILLGNKPIIDNTNKKDELSSLELIEYLTEGLEINKLDVDRYVASNIQVSKKFKEELKEGKSSYNIIHIATSVVKAPINFFKKISAKLLISLRGLQMIEKLNIRLDELEDSDLELLKEEEKDNIIFPLIDAKLKERKSSLNDMFIENVEEERIKQR